VARYLVGSLTAEYWYLSPVIGWLPRGEVLGDALRDLRPKQGTLSVYEVSDNAAPAHIERIVVAIAAKGKDQPVDVAYRLFDPADVGALGIPVDAKMPGTTGDDEINRLHRNLEQLTANKLGQLATVMASGQRGEVLSKHFERILRREVGAQRLKLHGVNGKLREALGLS
jgi:hypothetical protein